MATTTNRKLPKLSAQGQQYLVANEAHDDLDAILSALLSISMTADHTVTEAESQNLGFKATGTLTGDVILTVPFKMPMLVQNSTTGAFTITVKSGAGDTVEVPQGALVWLYSDGTNILAPLPPGYLDQAAMDARYLQSSNDLSEVDAGNARDNLGLGGGVSTTVANPTSITVVNGIVTAVS